MPTQRPRDSSCFQRAPYARRRTGGVSADVSNHGFASARIEECRRASSNRRIHDIWDSIHVESQAASFLDLLRHRAANFYALEENFAV
jgi:hypothetical protein